MFAQRNLRRTYGEKGIKGMAPAGGDRQSPGFNFVAGQIHALSPGLSLGAVPVPAPSEATQRSAPVITDRAALIAISSPG